MNSRVSIIGQGIVGLSCAYRFAKAGHRVSIYGNPTARPASDVATGISTMKGHRIARDLLFRIKSKGHAYFKNQLKELAALHHFPYGETVFEPFIDEDDYYKITTRVYGGLFQRPFGNKKIVAHESNWSARPAVLRDDLAGYYEYPGDLWCDASALLSVLAGELRRLGVKFISAEVLKICESRKDDQILFTVHSSASDEETEHVIVCAGPATPELLSASGFSILGFSTHPAATADFSTSNSGSGAFVHHKNVFVFAKDLIRIGSIELSEGIECEGLESSFRTKLSDLFQKSYVLETSSIQCANRLRFLGMMPFCGPVYLSEPKRAPIYVATGVYKNGFQLADFIACNLVLHVNTGHFIDSEMDELQVALAKRL